MVWHKKWSTLCLWQMIFQFQAKRDYTCKPASWLAESKGSACHINVLFELVGSKGSPLPFTTGLESCIRGKEKESEEEQVCTLEGKGGENPIHLRNSFMSTPPPPHLFCLSPNMSDNKNKGILWYKVIKTNDFFWSFPLQPLKLLWTPPLTEMSWGLNVLVSRNRG